MTRAKFVLIVCLVGFVGVIVAVLLATRPAPGGKPVPDPNGYDDFVRAAAALGDLPDKPEELPPDALRDLVTQHAGALRDLRTGLRHGASVPPAALGPWSSAAGDVLIGFRDLGRLLAAEGRLELVNGRTNDAARIYGEVIQFGAELCRGGPIIHRQVGVAVESMGATRLHPLVPMLDRAACRDLLKALEATDQRRESTVEVLANEAEWVRRNSPLLSRILFKLLPASVNPSRRSRQGVLAGITRQEAAIRQLKAEVAARSKPPE